MAASGGTGYHAPGNADPRAVMDRSSAPSPPPLRWESRKEPLMRRLLLCLVVLAFALRSTGQEAGDAADDVILRGGRVVDGTGNPWFRADVAVRGDRIAAVGHLADAKARREIDARQLVVAPGFVDIHSHSDYLLLEDGN